MSDRIKYFVEKGIPRISLSNREGVYEQLADQMEVGDSVLFEADHKAAALFKALRFKGADAETRKVEGGRRVWRINRGENKRAEKLRRLYRANANAAE